MTDTIAAIATPLGEGGLAIIRLSGEDSVVIAQRCFRAARSTAGGLDRAPSHTVHYGHILRNGAVVDEVLLTLLRAPRTYTREDVVEISCHGGLVAVRTVLETILSAGARAAGPGEFTQRAFLNGRLDLAQAEAVADVIHARTNAALAAAEEQLAGRLSQRIDHLREMLLGAQAHIEAHIDFPDEDLQPDTRHQLLNRLNEGLDVLDQLLATAYEGQVLRRGVRAVILGRTNAGKSTLLNQLLGYDRAIVSPHPGTTRDTIEETANIRGIPVVFIDTAGLRAGGDAVEEEGIRRSHASARRAELILHVLDASEPLSDLDGQTLQDLAPRKRLVVLNKTDLPPRLRLPNPSPSPCVEISAGNGDGMERLKEAIERLIWAGAVHSEMHQATINARHQDALTRARDGLVRAREAFAANQPPELAAMELRIAVQAVGEVVGKTTTEDLLDQIFGQFCIGK